MTVTKLRTPMFETMNIAQAAFCYAKGYALAHVRRRGDGYVFAFPLEATRAGEDYLTRQSVIALDFVNALRSLRQAAGLKT